MKIIHVCMHSFLDGWGYQENLLAEYMSKAGHDVVVVSSRNKFPSYLKKEEIERIYEKGPDYYLGSIHIYRINRYINLGNTSFLCFGLTSILKKEKPDLIFHHGVNNYTMVTCAKYCHNHSGVKMVVDNHADEINLSPHKLWNKLYQDILLKKCVKAVDPDVSKYYGVTPGRCDFLANVYGAPQNKIKLLAIGGDTDKTDGISLSREQIRLKMGVSKDALVIITGGKMGKDKGTMDLIGAFKNLKSIYPKICLALFGRFMDEETERLSKETTDVYSFGWCNREDTLELLKMSDIACWPIHHTTLIEDAVASAIPLVVRRTSNTSHLLENNGMFVENGKQDELERAFDTIIKKYVGFKEDAIRMHDKYSYKNIVKQVEDDYYNE